MKFKKLIFNCLSKISTRIFPLFYPLLKNKLCILYYHDVGPVISLEDLEVEKNNRVDPNVFEKQILFLKKYFRFISPQDLDVGQYKTPACLLTFDDGKKGIYKYAWPILKKHNIPFVIFVNGAFIDNSDISWDHKVIKLYKIGRLPDLNIKSQNLIPNIILELKANLNSELLTIINRAYRQNIGSYPKLYLSREELIQIAQSPLATIGNHTYLHRVSSRLTLKEFWEDFQKNNEFLEKITQRPVKLFSAPFGLTSDYTLEQVEKINQNNIKFFSAFGGLNKAFLKHKDYKRICVGNSKPNAFALNLLLGLRK